MNFDATIRQLNQGVHHKPSNQAAPVYESGQKSHFLAIFLDKKCCLYLTFQRQERERECWKSKPRVLNSKDFDVITRNTSSAVKTRETETKTEQMNQLFDHSLHQSFFNVRRCVVPRVHLTSNYIKNNHFTRCTSRLFAATTRTPFFIMYANNNEFVFVALSSS